MTLATWTLGQGTVDQSMVDAQVRLVGFAWLIVFGVVYYVLVVLLTWLAFRMLVRRGSIVWLIGALMGIGGLIFPIGALINVPFGSS